MYQRIRELVTVLLYLSSDRKEGDLLMGYLHKLTWIYEYRLLEVLEGIGRAGSEWG